MASGQRRPLAFSFGAGGAGRGAYLEFLRQGPEGTVPAVLAGETFHNLARRVSRRYAERPCP